VERQTVGRRRPGRGIGGSEEEEERGPEGGGGKTERWEGKRTEGEDGAVVIEGAGGGRQAGGWRAPRLG